MARERRGELLKDRLEMHRAEYLRQGPARSNLRYGYVTPPSGGFPHDVFA